MLVWDLWFTITTLVDMSLGSVLGVGWLSSDHKSQGTMHYLLLIPQETSGIFIKSSKFSWNFQGHY